MQDWTGCNELEQDNGSNGDRISITLTDKRDGNEYTVVKLKDGKCWMVQDLKIEGKSLTPEDSDVTNVFELPASKITNSFVQSNIAYAYTDGNIKPQCGGYYSWFAATAGEGTSSMASRNNVNVSQSICPKGWDLPTASQFETFTSAYNANGVSGDSSSTIVRNAPINLNDCGVAYSGSINMLMTDNYIYNWGGYWTSTGGGVYGGSKPTILIMNMGDAVYVQHGWLPDYYGFQVRCILR